MSDRVPDDEHIRKGELDPRELLAAGLIGELILDIRGLAHTAATLASELVLTNERVTEVISLRRRNLALVLVVTLLGAASLLGTWAFLGRLSTAADDARAAATEARGTGRLIAECITPAPPPEEAIDEDDLVHECYEASLRRQEANVANLDRAAVDAAICAITNVGTPIPAAVEACYEARANARLTATTTTTP